MISYKKILLLLAIVAITLIYFEIGTRILSVKDNTFLSQRDPDFGLIHKKNFSGNIWSNEANKYIFTKTNSLGFMGDEMPAIKPDDVFRIGFFGSSMIEGLQVNYPDHFMNLLKTALNENGTCKKKIEIINFGIAGEDGLGDYQIYKKLGPIIKLDLIILGFSNTFNENAETNRDLDNYRPRFARLRSILFKSEFLKYLFVTLSGNQNFRNIMQSFDLIRVHKASLANETNTVSKNETKNEPPSSDNYISYVIGKLNEKIKEDKGKLSVLMIPASPGYDFIDAWQKNSELTTLTNFLNKQKIPIINPFNDFAVEKNKSGKCMEINCGGHYNEYGHQIMAEVLYKYLLSSNIIDKKVCR